VKTQTREGSTKGSKDIRQGGPRETKKQLDGRVVAKEKKMNEGPHVSHRKGKQRGSSKRKDNLE